MTNMTLNPFLNDFTSRPYSTYCFFKLFNIVVYKQYFVGTFPKPSMMFKCILSHLLLHIVLTCGISIQCFPRELRFSYLKNS